MFMLLCIIFVFYLIFCMLFFFLYVSVRLYIYVFLCSYDNIGGPKVLLSLILNK